MKKQQAMLMTSYTDLYFKAKRRYDELLQIKNSKEMTLEKMPPGKIHVSKTQHGVQYYLRQDSTDKTVRTKQGNTFQNLRLLPLNNICKKHMMKKS